MTGGYDDSNADLTFLVGGTVGTIVIDNVSLKKIGTFTPPEPPEMVYNGDFSYGGSYWSYCLGGDSGATAQGTISNGKFTMLAAESARGSASYACQLISDKKNLTMGRHYRLSLDASSTVDTDSMQIGLDNGNGSNYKTWDGDTLTMSNSSRRYSYVLTMTGASDDPTARLFFFFGNTVGTIAIDNVSLVPLP